ncbi:MAG: FAD-dependent oxidoreductase, partial [Dehalococcoidia bacterium]
MEPPTPTIGEVVESLLVVGGGIAGMTAALEAAEAGHDVVLVEKQPALGGWLAQFHKLYPTRSPYRDLWTMDLDAKIRVLNEHPRIKVYTGAEIKNISGEPGTFQVTVQQNGNAVEFQTGAVVMATGWQPQESGLEKLGYGKHANVITNVQLEAMAKEGKITRPSDGKPARRVAFLQRPGLSQEQKFSFGCNVVDMATLKQAIYIRELDPASDVYIIYEDMVALGTYEAFYRRVQEEPGVYFTKGDVVGVSEDGKGNLLLELEHSLLGERVSVPVDMVVLATGMVPSTADSPVLNLMYRQGPGLPKAKFGFSDSNFICFPYETSRTGLYAAGSVREPMDVRAAIDDATGAALKAIQSLQLVSKGEATHPRSGDLSLPITRLQGCTKCGRCSEECPFSAIEVEESGYPTLNPDRCRRCGICMGACPVQVISFEDYSVGQLSAMVKAIQFSEDEEKPRILALACENDAYPAFDMAGINRMAYDASVRVIPLRCLGSLNVAVVADAISRGVDGVMLIGCKSGEDYQCHFIQGSELAGRRMENVKETLGRLMIEPERVKPLELEITEYDLIPAMVSEFVDEIKRMGPNPYKGF